MKLMGESNAFNKMRFNSLNTNQDPNKGRERNPQSYNHALASKDFIVVRQDSRGVTELYDRRQVWQNKKDE